MSAAKPDFKDLPLEEQVESLRKQFMVAIVFALGLLTGWSIARDK